MSRKKFGIGGLIAVGIAAAAAGAVAAYLRNEEIKKVAEEVAAKFRAAQDGEFDDDFEPACENDESCFDDDLDDGMPEVILAAEAEDKQAEPDEAAGSDEANEEEPADAESDGAEEPAQE